jgi:quinol monooxygenase YgiN
MSFILQVKVTVDPANAGTFLNHFKQAYDHVLAEPECVLFVVGQSTTELGVFQWTEGWTKDPQWFMTVFALACHQDCVLKSCSMRL